MSRKKKHTSRSILAIKFGRLAMRETQYLITSSVTVYRFKSNFTYFHIALGRSKEGLILYADDRRYSQWRDTSSSIHYTIPKKGRRELLALPMLRHAWLICSFESGFIYLWQYRYDLLGRNFICAFVTVCKLNQKVPWATSNNWPYVVLGKLR